MNKFLSPAFATALTLVATVGFAQPRTAYSGFTPVNHGQGSVGSTVSSNARSASVSRTTMGSNMESTFGSSTLDAEARRGRVNYKERKESIAAQQAPARAGNVALHTVAGCVELSRSPPRLMPLASVT